MITYDRLSFFKEGKPWLPIMGEYQYSRSDCRYWADGLAKMKALGIDVVASYAFWLCHEEIKGRYNFRGNHNLRKFVREIQDAGMYMCLRIGPWVHAEARNGGFPDWIYEQGYTPRTNDPRYMADVERYFKELYKQCEGYLYKDGGPIFAIQVENEYSQWGKQGVDFGDVHINALIDMLKRIGFDVPVYMATGWGEAAIGEAIPVWGGYSEAPWERNDKPLSPSSNYLFSPNPNDSKIGSDTGDKEMQADVSKLAYPYATVELGAGIQVTKIRRPIIRGIDNAAIAHCRLGSGCSALGYYVFQGGVHPIGALSTTQEYRREGKLEAGFCCDLPEMDYDFQAAISQYGRIHDSGLELKLCNYFARFFGQQVCRMTTRFPVDNATRAGDLEGLRYAVRGQGESGFLFFNNYVRGYDLPARTLKNFSVQTDAGRITFPQIRLRKGEYCALPFGLSLRGGGKLVYATATPFCTLNGSDYVFWSEEGENDYRIEGEFSGKILTLTKAEARNAYVFEINGRDTLLLSDCELFESARGIELCATQTPKLKIYPRSAAIPDGFVWLGEEGDFAVYEGAKVGNGVRARADRGCQREGYIDYTIDIDYPRDETENVFLSIDFGGDKIELLIDGEKVNDHFYTGEAFEVGLKNYGFPKRVVARVYPLAEQEYIYLEKQPVYTNGVAAYLGTLSAEREERIIVFEK